ncbi:hypothetical protein K440DRAFT_639908 [Wilcoxina mikolae CBS 423.85]|nr:hypothetical protein K440DRAFT_639908 [Wilcoxina mikolae CBS 423.85]
MLDLFACFRDILDNLTGPQSPRARPDPETVAQLVDFVINSDNDKLKLTVTNHSVSLQVLEEDSLMSMAMQIFMLGFLTVVVVVTCLEAFGVMPKVEEAFGTTGRRRNGEARDRGDYRSLIRNERSK